MTSPERDPQRLAEELESVRAALLELARAVPQSSIYGATARPGWTLKHELAALAAAAAELMHVLDELRRSPLPRGGLDLRRRFGETMLATIELGLPELLARLETGGRDVATVLREHAELLERPLRVAGREVSSMLDLVQAHGERGRRAVEAFDQPPGC